MDVVIYYSLGGTTKAYAEKASSDTGANLVRVREAHGRNIITAFIPGCPQAMKGAQPRIKPLGVDLEDYDNITLAAPIWAGHPAPAINSVAALLPPGKSVKVVLTSGGGTSNSDALKALIESRGCTVSEVIDIKSGEIKRD
jgi:flavodoxin